MSPASAVATPAKARALPQPQRTINRYLRDCLNKLEKISQTSPLACLLAGEGSLTPPSLRGKGAGGLGFQQVFTTY